MPRKNEDLGSKELRIRSEAHAVLLRKTAELHLHWIKSTEGEDALVNRGIVIAIRYLLQQSQQWEYAAKVQMHVRGQLTPKPNKHQMSMIMNQIVELMSQKTASTAPKRLELMGSSRTTSVAASR